jgi:hypothetical protein
MDYARPIGVGPVTLRLKPSLLSSIVCGVIFASLSIQVLAQNDSNARAFPQSKATVEKALTALQANLAGRLPTLDGFAKPGEYSLDRYQRGYYQSSVEVSSTPSGGCLVRVTTRVTAWYSDPGSAHSGYQLLPSNGRLEADLLDQLADQLAQVTKPAAESSSRTASIAQPKSTAQLPAQPVPTVPKPKQSSPATSSPASAQPETTLSAPAPKFPATDHPLSSKLSEGLANEARDRPDPNTKNAAKSDSSLQAEAESLEEILKNQAHPKNLVAVKKSGTPVVFSPSLSAKPEFLASMHDEFELLDFNPDWVHVRISGLSRGWIWRTSVEMPEGTPETSSTAASELTPAADLFRVAQEETAVFPGDWAPLRGKNVKILSVQKVDDNSKDAGPKARIEYTKFLLEKSYKELAEKTPQPAGIVVIFDSADGGMIAATMDTLQQWRAGALSDSALWHRCFFDPPETFDSPASSANQ